MSDNYPLVSVLIPCHNGSHFLESLVGHLNEQTFRDFEVIITVSSSSEDDPDRIAEVASTLDRCSVVRQTGTGLGDARNDGISRARGKYIWFLDIDDVPLPEFLEDNIRVIESTGSDIVFCNHFQTSGNDIPEEPKGPFTVREYTRREAVEHISEFPVYSWSRIQKRSVFEDGSCLFRDCGAMEDYDQTVREILCSEKVCYYGRPLYIYIRNDASASKKNRGKEADVLEESCIRNLELVTEKEPTCRVPYTHEVICRMMRQPAFAGYGTFRDWYKRTSVRRMIREYNYRTMEMRVFGLSGTLYYLAIYPFTHWVWDKKKGTWGPL